MIFKEGEKGITYVLVQDMFNLKLVETKKFKSSVELGRQSYYKEFSELKQLHGKEIVKEQTDKMVNYYRKYQRPVYFKTKESYFNKRMKDNGMAEYSIIDTVEIYEYARYEYQRKLVNFDKKILEEDNHLEKYNDKKKKSFFGFLFKKKYEFTDYRAKKDEYVNKYIRSYMDWYRIQFAILKLPQSLVKELEDAVLVNLRFDLIKPIIILDNIVEKIYSFIYKGKKLEGNNAMELLINASMDDFTAYIRKQINLIKDIKNNQIYDELEIDTKLLTEINSLKKALFKDETEILDNEPVIENDGKVVPLKKTSS